MFDIVENTSLHSEKRFETAECDFFDIDEFVSHAKVTRGRET